MIKKLGGYLLKYIKFQLYRISACSELFWLWLIIVIMTKNNVLNLIEILTETVTWKLVGKTEQKTLLVHTVITEQMNLLHSMKD